MTKPVDDSTLAELNRAIRLTLNPPASTAKQRLAELGFLASLLNPLPPRQGFGFPTLQRKEYDRLRPATATSSAVLVKRYRSWNAACYAAYGLQPDGRWTGPGRPWPSPHGRPAIEALHTRQRYSTALRQCQRELGRRATDNVYARWRREKQKRRAETRDNSPAPIGPRHLPALPRSPGGWNSALRDAGSKGRDQGSSWHGDEVFL